MTAKSGKASVGHWQDFSTPVTLSADQAAELYRTIHSVNTTLRIAAEHFSFLAADRRDLMALSVNDVEALLSGAVQLAASACTKFEEIHA